MPFFATRSPKLITSPSLNPASRKYVSVGASKRTLCCATALHSTITSPPTIKCAKAVLVGLLTALAVLNLGYGFQGTGKALGE